MTYIRLQGDNTIDLLRIAASLPAQIEDTSSRISSHAVSQTGLELLQLIALLSEVTPDGVVLARGHCHHVLQLIVSDVDEDIVQVAAPTQRGHSKHAHKCRTALGL